MHSEKAKSKLLTAVYFSNLNEVIEALEDEDNPVDVNTQFTWGASILYHACLWKDNDIVQYLINKNVKITEQDFKLSLHKMNFEIIKATIKSNNPLFMNKNALSSLFLDMSYKTQIKSYTALNAYYHTTLELYMVIQEGLKKFLPQDITNKILGILGYDTSFTRYHINRYKELTNSLDSTIFSREKLACTRLLSVLTLPLASVVALSISSLDSFSLIATSAITCLAGGIWVTRVGYKKLIEDFNICYKKEVIIKLKDNFINTINDNIIEIVKSNLGFER